MVEALNGSRNVRISRDMRPYLCSRTDHFLLESRMVTPSIRVGGGEYLVEEVGGHGTELLLDRPYRGLSVGPHSSEERAGSRAKGDSGGEAGAEGRGGMADARTGFGFGLGLGLDSTQEKTGGQVLPREKVVTGGGATTEANGAGAKIGSGESREHIFNNAGPSQMFGAEDRGGRRASSAPTSRGKVWSNEPQTHRQLVNWKGKGKGQGTQGAHWMGGARKSLPIFAKLKALFSDGEAPGTPLVAAVVGSEHSATDPNRNPKWVVHPVIGWSNLDLPVSCLTCHPDMPFILAGLPDGMVAVLAPQGRGRL
ncbi:unnamed protein product [Discosporangium mesarthrocarpum]